MSRSFASIAVAAVIACSALTCAAQQVSATEAWARATVPGQKSAAAYVQLTSASNAALVAAASPIAEKVELHNMRVEGGVMRMRPVKRLELPAGKTVKLAPGGLHLMLMGVSRPLKAGEKVPLVLSFEAPGSGSAMLQVEAEVRAAGTTGPHHH